LDFLNELLKEEQGQITDLTYLKTEQLGASDIDRKAIFDLYCENEKGEKFIVELQKSKQNFFKDRTVYYSTFPIREQAKRADWDYELKAVYTIAILDFVFDSDTNEPDKFRYEDSLKYYRDLKNSLDTARDEGIIEGIEKVAKNALKIGKTISEIIELTGLTKEQIEKLK